MAMILSSDKSSPEYAERVEWLEENFGIDNFDPEFFDLELINEQLHRIKA